MGQWEWGNTAIWLGGLPWYNLYILATASIAASFEIVQITKSHRPLCRLFKDIGHTGVDAVFIIYMLNKVNLHIPQLLVCDIVENFV